MKNKKLIDHILDPVSLRWDVREAMKRNFAVYMKSDMAVYDIGCGDKPFAEFLKGRVKAHIGVDIEEGFYDTSHIDLVGSAYDVPIADGQADAVISSQVIEHLKDPAASIVEANRILRHEGMLFLSFPFMYPLHAAPHDFFRYSEYGAQELLERYGFKILKIEGQGGFWYVMAIFWGIYLNTLNRGVFRKLKIGILLNMVVKWFFYLLHLAEGYVYKLCGKDADIMRRNWMTNYAIVAQKVTGVPEIGKRR